MPSLWMRRIRLCLRGSLCVSAVLTAVLVLCAPMSAAGPDPSRFYLQSFTYGGSACPQGAVGAAFNDKRTLETSAFDAFVARVGTGVPITESRKNCQLNFNFNVPAAPASSIVTLTAHGFAQLSAGQIAEVKLILFWDGAIVKTITNLVHGPTLGNYTQTGSVLLGAADGVSSVRPLNVNSSIKIIDGGSHPPAQATVDFINIVSDGSQS